MTRGPTLSLYKSSSSKLPGKPGPWEKVPWVAVEWYPMQKVGVRPGALGSAPPWFVPSVSAALLVNAVVPVELIGNSLSARHWWEHDGEESFTPAFQGKHSKDVDVHRRPSWTGTATELSENK